MKNMPCISRLDNYVKCFICHDFDRRDWCICGFSCFTSFVVGSHVLCGAYVEDATIDNGSKQ